VVSPFIIFLFWVISKQLYFCHPNTVETDAIFYYGQMPLKCQNLQGVGFFPNQPIFYHGLAEKFCRELETPGKREVQGLAYGWF
jgi:hypothetical protein